MENRDKTIAVMGTGSIGLRHLHLLRQQPGLRPIAIPKRRDRIAWLETEGYATARDLPEARKLGATMCIVATDTGQHVADGLSAVAEGLDVMVEKPMAVDAEAAGRLHQGGKSSKRKIFVGCTLRFSESLNTFRQGLAEVGPLHTIHIECESYLPLWRPDHFYKESYSARKPEGGVLLDLIHEIDYLGWIFGWPTAVQATLRNTGRLGVQSEEICHLSMNVSGGCMAHVSLDYLSRPPRRGIRARGERGTIEWDGLTNTVTLSVEAKTARQWMSGQSRDDMILSQTMAFMDACQGSTDRLPASAEEGVKALAVCDAARRSSLSRREEQIVYP